MWIKNIRNKLGLSQLQLAGLLGVSKSQIGMAEKGRRDLPASALIKLVDLEQKVENNYEAAERYEKCLDKQDKELRLMVKKARIESVKLTRESDLLMYKLEKMETAYQKSLASFKTNRVVAENFKIKPSSRREAAWLDMNEVDAQHAYNISSLAKQAAIRIEIELLDARARVYNEFIRNYSLAIRPPVQIDVQHREVLLLKVAG